MFEVRSLEFVKTTMFAAKNNFRFETKSTLFRAFLGKNLKKLLSYLKSVLSNLSKLRNLHKTKKIRFGAKYALSEYF